LSTARLTCASFSGAANLGRSLLPLPAAPASRGQDRFRTSFAES
jgi:hypothetical protein